jgi:predicted transcriptional regulator
MAVISVRLSSEEEKIMEYLASFYDEDKSTLIKHSIKEMYEDLIDKKVIDAFEHNETKRKPKYMISDDILKMGDAHIEK